VIPGFGSSRLKEESVASAATIRVNADLVRITGTTTVDNIQSSLIAGAGGLLIFVYTNGAGVTLSAAGNIAVSQALATNRLYVYVWSDLAQKWIPHGVV
jgi:hypothetical protein